MTAANSLIIASSLLLVLCGFVHSYFGEKFLLTPMLKARGNRVLEHDLARLVLRFGWHVATAAWWLLAAIVYSLADDRLDTISVVVYGTSISFIAIGLFDLVVSRGRHIGWPILLMIGVCLLLSVYV